MVVGLGSISGCVAVIGSGNSGGKASGSKPSLSESITRTEAIATWTLTDSENESFNVILASDGSAVDTWWKGSDGAKGERGRWEIAQGAIDIRYGSGWRDVISRSPLGFRQVSYAPGLAPGSGPSSDPNHDGQAIKVVGDGLRFVGVWIIQGALPGPKYELFVALRSDGMARKSIDSLEQGTWIFDAGTARIYWSDGWHTTLESMPDGSVFGKSWKPGVALTEMPTGSAPAHRITK